MASAEQLRIVVVYSPAARVVEEVSLALAAPVTLGDAVRASGLLTRHPQLKADPLDAGIWGKPRAPETMLRDGDRVELYRPLTVDPKEARRQRQARQGVKPRLRR